MGFWESIGSPVYPTPAQTAKMQQASAATQGESIAVKAVSATESAVSFPMEGSSVVYFAL
jgi:hypothetical protein